MQEIIPSRRGADLAGRGGLLPFPDLALHVFHLLFQPQNGALELDVLALDDLQMLVSS